MPIRRSLLAIAQQLRPGSLLLSATNNCLSVRDQLLYLSLALLLWPMQRLRLRHLRSSTDWELRRQLVSFKSLFYRQLFFYE